jgi:hypothetical protein
MVPSIQTLMTLLKQMPTTACPFKKFNTKLTERIHGFSVTTKWVKAAIKRWTFVVRALVASL